MKSDGFIPFCLFGHSRGANDVLLYASKFSNSDSTTETNIKKIINDSRESKIDNIENNMIKLEIKKNEIENQMEKELKIEINKNENFLILPKNLEEISNEREKEISISTTPRTITTLSSSSLLSDLSNDLNIDTNVNMNRLSMNSNENLKFSESIPSLEVEKDVEKKVEKEVEKEEDSRNDYFLDSEKLIIVVAAPRFNMPKMLTTLFSQDQIELLGSDGQFEWSSNEKGNYYFFSFFCYIVQYYMI